MKATRKTSADEILLLLETRLQPLYPDIRFQELVYKWVVYKYLINSGAYL